MLADEQAYTLVLESEADLAGLPDYVRAAARAAAQERGLAHGHVITLSRSSVEPFLQFSARRDLREKAFRAWIARGEGGGETDNKAIIAEMVALRAERAALLGYETFAHYRLDDAMAKTPAAVRTENFLVQTINKLQKSPDWKDTAVIILYDDSDGWYDHVMGPIVNQSNVADDQLLGPGNCGTPKPDDTGAIENGRCGYGPRLPLLVISPYARTNFVDHRVTDQSSVIRFIEDNWDLGRIGNGSADAIAGTLDGLFDFGNNGNNKLFLDPLTGKPAN